MIPNSRKENDTRDYVYKHVQIGSSYIPYGGHQPTPIVQPNKTFEYFASVDTTIIQPPSTQQPNRYHSWRRPKTLYVTRNGSTTKRTTCFKCPSEQLFIAPKGTDAVIIKNLPVITNCHNQALSRDHYKLKALAGDTPFLLPAGSHSFLAQIVNKQTEVVEQLCTLKYRVMVHRCPTYTPQNKGLRIKCASENLWGSSCAFTCRDGGYMSQPGQVLCNDHLEWSGEEPYCHYHGKIRGLSWLWKSLSKFTLIHFRFGKRDPSIHIL